MARNKKVSIKEQTEIITEKVREALQSDRFKDLLKCPDMLLAFRKEVLGQEPYSFNNRLTLGLFGARAVAGFRTWLTLGYHVKKGSNGIPIFRPVIVNKRDEENNNTDEQPRIVGFNVVHVFDIAQVEESTGTESEEKRRKIVEFFAGREKQKHFCQELRGGDPNLTDKLVAWAGLSVPVEFKTGLIRGKGFTDGKRIVIKQGMAAAQTMKTLLHELAHIRLGHIGSHEPTRDAQEVQAESAAYIASYLLGIDTGAYSFDYLASWGNAILEQQNGLEEFQQVVAKALTEGQAMAEEYEMCADLSLPVAV